MPRILIIEDDESFRPMLRQVLCREGHDVLEACNGREAIDLLEHESVNLVITDIIMPEQEGLETIRQFRENHPIVKIIAMSGGGRCSSQDYLPVAKRLGADHILYKPFSRQELLLTVRDLLSDALKFFQENPAEAVIDPT
jgi:DNA-binding response OmpR family regulator